MNSTEAPFRDAPPTSLVPVNIPTWVDRSAYPFALRRVEVSDGTLNVVDVGTGPVLLFVHGTPTWSFEYRHLIHHFSKTHRCIAPDHLGFGLSDRPENADYRPEAHARRLREVVEQLDLHRVTLVVHDFGGPIGLPLALGDFDAGSAPADGDVSKRETRISSVVVLNSWMWPLDGDRSIRRTSRLISGALGRFLYGPLNVSLRALLPGSWGNQKKLTPAIRAQYLAPFPSSAARVRVLWTLARSLIGSGAHYQKLWDRRNKLTKLPVLIVWGTRDPAFPTHHLDRWKEALPQALVQEVDAGHWPHEEQPAAVIDAMEKFLRG